MAWLTRTDYTGDGITTDRTIGFPYIAQSDVKVYVNDVLLSSSAYSFPSSTILRISPAVANGASITLKRQTDRSIVTLLQFATTPSTAEFNNILKRVQYIAQEVADAIAEGSIQLLGNGSWDAGARRLINLVNGVSGQDACTVAQAQSIATSGGLPVATGNATRYLRQNATTSGLEYRTQAQTQTDLGLPNGTGTANDLVLVNSTANGYVALDAGAAGLPLVSQGLGVAPAYAAISSGGLGSAIVTSAKMANHTVTAITGTTTVLASARATILELSGGGYTVTLDTLANCGAGWYVDVAHVGTGRILIDPTGSEQIENQTSIPMYPGERYRIFVNQAGTQFRTLGRQLGQILLATTTVSGNPTSVDFTTFINSDFDEYEIQYQGLQPATNNVDLWLRVSTDGGATYLAGASDYYHNVSYLNSSATLGNTNAINAAQGLVLRTVPNTAICGGVIRVLSASSSSFFKGFIVEGLVVAAAPERSWGFCEYKGATTAINAIRLLFSAGNITSGSFKLFGVRRV